MVAYYTVFGQKVASHVVRCPRFNPFLRARTLAHHWRCHQNFKVDSLTWHTVARHDHIRNRLRRHIPRRLGRKEARRQVQRPPNQRVKQRRGDLHKVRVHQGTIAALGMAVMAVDRASVSRSRSADHTAESSSPRKKRASTETDFEFHPPCLQHKMNSTRGWLAILLTASLAVGFV